jgi:hypothetical protein
MTDCRLSATGVKREDVGFSGVAKSDLWKRGFKFRSALIGPDGVTVLPWGKLPGWTGWLPPRCTKTSPELRQQMIFDHAQQLGKVEEWPPLAAWEPRVTCGEHDQGLGVGAWVIGLQNGVQQLGQVMAWNWYKNKELDVAEGGLLGGDVGATARPVERVQ